MKIALFQCPLFRTIFLFFLAYVKKKQYLCSEFVD